MREADPVWPKEQLPEWAEFLAQDADGTWWAYEAHPNQNDTGWYENEVGRIWRLGKTAAPDDCHATLARLAGPVIRR
jgi:hypothetical protein